MSAHLAGWRLSAGDECTVFDGADKKLVTVPCGGLSGRTVGEAEDCARLIAAAPDLLAAAEKALNFIANTERELGITLDSGDAIRAAIAKAKAS